MVTEEELPAWWSWNDPIILKSLAVNCTRPAMLLTVLHTDARVELLILGHINISKPSSGQQFFGT